MKRREFLKAAAAAGTAASASELLSGCSKRPYLETIVPEFTAEQLARKKQGRSKVALVRCDSYEDDILARLKEYVLQVDFPDMKGKRVVLKPNMVEFHEGHQITTNPAVLTAAIKLAADQGAAEVIVAEGPGHMRDTEYLLDGTGLGKACTDAGVRFVDLNLDDLVKVPNKNGFNKMKHFYMPRTIMDADVVVSVPKLKTHHWVGVTCSMKNLFGTVPGRKYGWPKNLLHHKGIPFTIIDLVNIVKPQLAIVDAIVSMEGDGPINGTPLHTGFVAMGSDLAAVDATCCRITQIKPEQLSYMIIAGKVVGNTDEEMIDVIGESVASLEKPFEQPITIKNKSLLAEAASSGS